MIIPIDDKCRVKGTETCWQLERLKEYKTGKQAGTSEWRPEKVRKKAAFFVALLGVPEPQNVTPLKTELEPPIFVAGAPGKATARLGHTGPPQAALPPVILLAPLPIARELWPKARGVRTDRARNRRAESPRDVPDAGAVLVKDRRPGREGGESGRDRARWAQSASYTARHARGRSDRRSGGLGLAGDFL